MSSINPKEKRDVIPNWRSYRKTAQSGELYAMRSNTVSIPIFPINSYIEAWQECQTLPFAGDVVSAAILNGQTSLSEVVKAAQFILHHADAPKAMKKVSQGILSSTVKQDYSQGQTTDMIITSIEHKNEHTKSLIQFIKRQNIDFPYNPIAYCELARCYISLGHSQKAIENMRIALHLAPYSRYITRCAARLFTHLNDLELAHRIIVRNPAFKSDPWLVASEIAINTAMERNSRNVNLGKRIIESQNFSPFSCSELSSAIGTLEMANGSRKKCTHYINIALQQPNDNSLAQAEWIKSENNDLRLSFRDYSTLRFKAEADARYSYSCNQFNDSFRHSLNWVEDFPYDKSSVLFSSHIAYGFLKDYDSAARILRIGLQANPNEPNMLNNLAYVEALNGDVEEADKLILRLNAISSSLSIDTFTCLTATNGLIAFRKGEIIKGRELYLSAINTAKECASDKSLVQKAILNYLREELVANTCHTNEVSDILDKIDTKDDKEMWRLKEDVIAEINHRSSTIIENPFRIRIDNL